MTKSAFKNLFSSLDELHFALVQAKSLCADSKDPSHVLLLERIEQYEEILQKQKALAQELCSHAVLGNWDDFTRHIKIITGLSTLIRDDALSLLKAPRVNKPALLVASEFDS